LIPSSFRTAIAFSATFISLLLPRTIWTLIGKGRRVVC
jgi:hypothetical protein